jgi:hypothetical protein
MAEETPDYASIGPLNTAAQREAGPLTGLILLDMVAVVVALAIIGAIANALT